MIRGVAYLVFAYLLLIAMSAVNLLLPLHSFSPELVLLMVLHLGLTSRGSAAGNVAVGLALGYLVDLFSGAPRGLDALACGVVMVVALGAASRLLVSSKWQQIVVAGLVALGHGALVVALSSAMYDGEALQALRILPATALSTAIAAPFAFALFRRLDKKLQPDPARAQTQGMKAAQLRAVTSKGTQAPPRRLFWAQVAVLGAFTILAGRLVQLQVMSGDLYFKKSADNFVKELELPATRGRILDRAGHPLADDRPSYDVMITPRFFTDEALQQLARLVKLDDESVDALKVKVDAKKGLDRLRQLIAFEDVSRDDVALIESQAMTLPGVTISAAAHRNYPEGDLGSHVLGYMNQITPEELTVRRDDQDPYHLGDYVGRAGLERQFESFLRGKDGYEKVVVDAKGQRKGDFTVDEVADLIGEKPRVDPIPGHDLVTTIDLDLQKIVETALKKHKSAAAAVVDVDTGRVLALASWPEVDPNRLTGRLSKAEMDELVKDPARPLIDKTLRENYFPGSTFKVVSTIAALETKAVDPDARVFCHGAIQFGKRWFHCPEVHGPVNLHMALAESCDVYYYELGDTLGLDRMAEVAVDLGYGQPTGLGLNGEVPGFIPTVDWYKKRGEFQKGMVLNTAIGQGDAKVTVLQVAMAYAAIANGGKLWEPQLVERIVTPSGKVVQEFPPRLKHELKASPETLQQVRAALYDAVNHPKGTSYAARVPGLDIAGKTGTAQVHNTRHTRDLEEGDPDADHAWFASFAPSKHPRIAVVALVEHGGFGAKAATPIVMEIYRGYFARQAMASPGKSND